MKLLKDKNMANRLLHILNAEGDGKEAVFINGNNPQNHSEKSAALSEIVDYERSAAGKPSIWSGRLDGCYYASGLVIKDGRTMPFSFCSPSAPQKAQSELLADLKVFGYTIDEQTKKYLNHKAIITKAAVGICIAAIVITGLILLCK